MGVPTKNEQAEKERAPSRLDAAPFVVTLVAVGLFSFLAGGYILLLSSPVAIVYLLIAAVWVVLLRGPSRPPLLYLSALAALGLFVAWAGLSVLWSIGPDLSWGAFNLAAFYLAAAAIVGLTPAQHLHVKLVGYGFLTLIVAVSVYALLGKMLPETVTHAHRYARLSSPVGYWNVLALLIAMGLPIALAAAGSGSVRTAWRVLAAAAGVPLCLAFFFAFSRGGWLALAVMLVVFFSLSPKRLSSFASLVAIAAPSAAVVWLIRSRETLFASTTDAVQRSQDGHALLRWTLVALAMTATAQLLIAIAQRRVRWPRSWYLLMGGAVLVALIVAASIGSYRVVESRGGADWVHERARSFFADTGAGNSAERLTSVNTGRVPLWREALRQSEHLRWGGAGAGTFPLTHYRFRTDQSIARHAHSQWLNVLSEVGIVGLALFTTGVALTLAAAIRNPFAGRKDPARPLVAALQAGLVAFVVHISWDWDWDMAAAGTVFFLFAGTCASYLAGSTAGPCAVGAAQVDEAANPAPGHGGRCLPLRAGAALALVLLAASWTFPYLSEREKDAALTASADQRLQDALEHTRAAARLNVLAVDPLINEAKLLQQLGRNREALEVLSTASLLQPDNHAVHHQLGLLYLNAFGQKEQAAAALERALSLNPMDRDIRFELMLARKG
jgi:hypothetical protein